jgi:hypothetical protein
MEFKEIGKFENNKNDSLQSEILSLLDKYDIRLDPEIQIAKINTF